MKPSPSRLLALAVPLVVSAMHAASLPPPVIDMHLHALGAGDQGPPPLSVCVSPENWPAWDPARPWPEVFIEHLKNPACPDAVTSPLTDDALRDETLAVLRRRNVIGVLSGPAGRVQAWREAAPERIIPGLIFGGPPGPSPEELRAMHERGELAVFGEVTIQYRGISPSDPWFDPFLALAEEIDIPVGIHIGTGPPGAPYLVNDKYRAALHSPLVLEDALIRHPKLRVYIMHAGWPMIDDLLAVMWAHPQVYAEVGVIVWGLPRKEFYRFLQRIVEAGFGQRIMFGSDQMVWPGVIEPSIRVIEEAPFLNAQQKRDILYNNAARFLRLSDEEIERHHQTVERDGRSLSGPGGSAPSGDSGLRDDVSDANDPTCLTATSLSEHLSFATRAEAREILKKPDEWARKLSRFDRNARQRTVEETSLDQFLNFLGDAATEWTPDEKTYWGRHVRRLSEAMAGLNVAVADVSLVKTTGEEEFNFAYVRNRAIMVPRGRVEIAGDDRRRDFFLLAHEMFHYLSAENPEMCDALFALLGFERVENFVLPEELEARRLSNPLATSRQHALAVRAGDSMFHVVPMIQSTVPVEEIIELPSDGPPALLRMVEVVLVAVDLATGAVQRDGNRDLISYRIEETDWNSRMQRNTTYAIHPEETMADNFALLMEWRSSGAVPTETPSGYPTSDLGLLRSIEELLTSGCDE